VRSRTISPGPWTRAGAALTTVGVAAVLVGASLAGAASGWSRTPAAGFAGATIHVASSSSTLCRWSAPPTTDPTTDPPTSAPSDPGTGEPSSTTSTDAPVAVDGSHVELRLERAGIDVPVVSVPVGSVPVSTGGAWAGDFRVPPVDQAPAGNYQLIPHCVVDDPSLDGTRSFDFEPLPFGVVEGPPPTTVTAPPTIPPPITGTDATEVEGVLVSRATTSTADQAPTLPRTGDGTLAVGLAGVAAVLVGGVALWWGARAARRTRPFEPR
jgi:hypothetical protein